MRPAPKASGPTSGPVTRCTSKGLVAVCSEDWIVIKQSDANIFNHIDLLRPRLGRPFPVTHSRCVRPGSRLHLTRRVPLSVT